MHKDAGLTSVKCLTYAACVTGALSGSAIGLSSGFFHCEKKEKQSEIETRERHEKTAVLRYV